MGTKKIERRKAVREKFGKLIDLLIAESKKEIKFTHSITKIKPHEKIRIHHGADQSSTDLSH